MFSELFERYFLKNKGIYDLEEIEEAISSPIVVHYPGNSIDRPWFKGCTSRRKEHYYECKKKSPWKDDTLSDVPKISGKRLKFSGLIHSLQTKNTLFPLLLVINFFRQLFGPLLRTFKIFPPLPQEGIE